MLSLRARIFIVLSLIVFLILGISIFLFVRAKKQATANNLQNTTNNSPTVANLPETAPVQVTEITKNITVNPISSVDVQKNATEQMAKIFLERFNSYSSESQYQNVRDVQTLVSKSYWSVLSAKLPSIKPAQNVATAFSSTVTKAYGSKLVAWNEKNATVELQVKITEEKNNIVTHSDKQATVYLINESGSWLVDKFEWMK